MKTSLDETNKKDFATPLVEWFKKEQREMPWRETSDPYYIWVSEIMLQQTQVATVIPYYIKFMNRFPTVSDLAKATLEEVHTYWQGLGYYRRGENLWKGAKLIEERWQGQFPRDPQEVKEIPGIGPYTVGAICSIAFHLPLPAVDGNVMRVMSRWYEMSDDIGVAKNRKIFEERVMENMPDDPNRFNQGLMELGALICTPTSPRCENCPVNSLCRANLHQTQEQYPIKEKKLKKVEEHYVVPIFQKGHEYGWEKRPEEGLLANMWGLPMIDRTVWESHLANEDLYHPLPVVTHVFTHKKWHMQPYLMPWSKALEEKVQQLTTNKSPIEYFSLEALKAIPVATAFKKIIKQL